jgi:hypothetical protein
MTLNRWHALRAIEGPRAGEKGVTLTTDEGCMKNKGTNSSTDYRMTTMTTTETKTCTIILTDRAPVKIRDDQWPLIASAKTHDGGQHEHQANRTWSIRVRQHEDGRAIVYAIYGSNWQNEHGRRAGALLTADESIPDAIRRVGTAAGCVDCIDGCIADLPAVKLE